MPRCPRRSVQLLGLAASLALALVCPGDGIAENARSADAFVEFIGINTHLGYADTTYPIYAGNTHSHTVYTWSHGPQFRKAAPEDAEKKVSGISVSPEGVQTPAKSQILKPDWQKLQGPPSVHFALAKSNRYDFYSVTDHSQEAPFAPTSATNAAWLATKREASEAADDRFTALAGFEFSENNGPGGRGHINVFNPRTRS